MNSKEKAEARKRHSALLAERTVKNRGEIIFICKVCSATGSVPCTTSTHWRYASRERDAREVEVTRVLEKDMPKSDCCRRAAIKSLCKINSFNMKGRG